MRYWRWLVVGDVVAPGLRKFWDRWLILHVLVGVLLAYIVPSSLHDAAGSCLLPLAGVLIGLSFAWGGNAQTLLQTEEIERLAGYHNGGIRNYAYTFQTAILTILVTLVGWGLAGLNVYDGFWPTRKWNHSYFAVEAGHYFLASLALRECWQVVLAAQKLLVLRSQVRGKDSNS